MIISFSVENWMSFRDPVTFSMVASRERQHGDRVPRVAKYPIRILPVAAIYGGNASGKTNFFKALEFIKDLVVGGTRPDSFIKVVPFRLEKSCLTSPTRFKLEILVDDIVYEYSFALTRKSIIEEELTKITSASELTLYSRRDGKIKFDRSLENDERLQFVFGGTRENQLFLTNSVSQKVDVFKPIYEWFSDTLELIAPNSRFISFEGFLDKSNSIYSVMSNMLQLLDTGITHLGGEETPIENMRIPDELVNMIREDLQEGEYGSFLGLRNDRYVVKRTEGELVVEKLVTHHMSSSGNKVKFEIDQESDGTQRLIDLLPAFLDLTSKGSSSVYIIDEVDRSLHTLLLRQLIEFYLRQCNANSRSQLLFTTHDLLIMDQELLRRDEMWVTERDSTGNSSLIAFSDYQDIRYDKNIRKSYLQGRLGGIPQIVLPDATNELENNA